MLPSKVKERVQQTLNAVRPKATSGEVPHPEGSNVDTGAQIDSGDTTEQTGGDLMHVSGDVVAIPVEVIEAGKLMVKEVGVGKVLTMVGGALFIAGVGALVAGSNNKHKS